MMQLFALCGLGWDKSKNLLSLCLRNLKSSFPEIHNNGRKEFTFYNFVIIIFQFFNVNINASVKAPIIDR